VDDGLGDCGCAECDVDWLMGCPVVCVECGDDDFRVSIVDQVVCDLSTDGWGSDVRWAHDVGEWNRISSGDDGQNIMGELTVRDDGQEMSPAGGHV